MSGRVPKGSETRSAMRNHILIFSLDLYIVVNAPAAFLSGHWRVQSFHVGSELLQLYLQIHAHSLSVCTSILFFEGVYFKYFILG